MDINSRVKYVHAFHLVDSHMSWWYCFRQIIKDILITIVRGLADFLVGNTGRFTVFFLVEVFFLWGRHLHVIPIPWDVFVPFNFLQSILFVWGQSLLLCGVYLLCIVADFSLVIAVVFFVVAVFEVTDETPTWTRSPSSKAYVPQCIIKPTLHSSSLSGGTFCLEIFFFMQWI